MAVQIPISSVETNLEPSRKTLFSFIWKLLVFLFVLFSVLVIVLSSQNPKWVEGRKKEFFSLQKKRPVDLLVMGSSRAEHCFNTAMVDSEKFNVFNLGEDGHGFPSNYIMLKVMTGKYHIPIRKILLQVDEVSFNGSRGFTRKFRDDFFLTDLEDPEVYEAYCRYRGKSWAWMLRHYPPLANLVYDDFYKFLKRYPFFLMNEVPSLKHHYNENLNVFRKNRGYSPYTPSSYPIQKHHYILETDDVDYFEKIVSLCKAQNIELVFFRGPYMDCEKVQSPLFDSYMAGFLQLHPEIPYLDYKCNYQIPSQYMDQFHPADSIATLLSRDLINALHLK